VDRAALRGIARAAPIHHCGVGDVQKPFRQMLPGSQQSAAVAHFSCGCEQLLFGGVFEQTRAPPGPTGWQ
jgi:hypothetical protein